MLKSEKNKTKHKTQNQNQHVLHHKTKQKTMAGYVMSQNSPASLEAPSPPRKIGKLTGSPLQGFTACCGATVSILDPDSDTLIHCPRGGSPHSQHHYS